MNRKLEEKKDSYDRAVEEYDPSRGVSAAVVPDEPEQPERTADFALRKSITKMCESLVNSWYKNVEVARKRVGIWDFKSTRQTMAVMRVSKELANAEACQVPQGLRWH